VQPREGQLHLRLHAYHPRYLAPRGPSNQVLKQHGFSYARLAAHDQGPALTGPQPVDEPVERVAFATPVHEPWRAARGADRCH
jgi:hypothetical protein